MLRLGGGRAEARAASWRLTGRALGSSPRAPAGRTPRSPPAPPARPRPQACLAAVGVLTDLCSSVGADLAPRAGDILGVLIANLGDDNLHPSLRPQVRRRQFLVAARRALGARRGAKGQRCAAAAPSLLTQISRNPLSRAPPRPRTQILSTLGDLALALGPLLEPHMPLLLPALRAATAAAAAAAPSSAATGAGGAAAPPGRASPDVGAQDPAAELRIGVLEAYGGLFQVRNPLGVSRVLAAV